MDFVVQVLMHIFDKDIDDATRIMINVHEKGKENVGTYTKEIAETKVLLTLRAAENHQHPLLATTEEA
jgi:ATP-dependent Clp protease adaptor protein ClpS